MNTLLYVDSRAGDPSIDDQRRQAEALGVAIDGVVVDDGKLWISSPLADRPEGRRLLEALGRGDTLVVRWVDRFGRDEADAAAAIWILMEKGVIVRTLVGGLTFDGATTDPTRQAVREALLAFMVAGAEMRAEAAKQSQRAGIERAKADREKYRGRKPSFTRAQLAAVCAMLDQGAGPAMIARATGLSRQAVYRVQADVDAAEARLAGWGM